MGEYKIGILGNFRKDYEPHYEMNNCLRKAQAAYPFDFEWIPTEQLIANATEKLAQYHGIIAGSGPYLSKEGVINGIRYARGKNVPFLGTCSGFGYAVLEFAQSLFGLQTVYHPYEDPQLPVAETFLQPLKYCSKEMQTISFKPVKGTLTDKIYDHTNLVNERSHCIYGVHTQMIAPFAQKGLIVSGRDEHGEPKIMEYTPDNFFIITLFLPQLNREYKSLHPIIGFFLQAAGQFKKEMVA